MSWRSKKYPSYLKKLTFVGQENKHATSPKNSKRWRNKMLSMGSQLTPLRVLFQLFRKKFLFWVWIWCMGGFIGFAIFSPYFSVQRFLVSRNTNIDLQSVYTLLEEWRGQNMLFISTHNIREKIQKEFPEFNTIEITEKWPKEIVVNIESLPPIMNVLNESTANFFRITINGTVLSGETQAELPLLTVFDNENDPQPHTSFISSSYLQKIFVGEQQLERRLGLDIKQRHYYPKAREVHFIVENGIPLWVDLTVDVEDQIHKLERVADRIELYEREFNHIDLRISGRIYWEYKK